MRTIRIFTDCSIANGTEVTLTGSAANHVAKVLRRAVGDDITLFNGDGHEYIGEIKNLDKKTVSVEITDSKHPDRESPLAIHLGQVISRGDRMDYAIQKAVELGVTEITPLFSERCEVKLKGDRLEKKLKHWQQIAISACEQSYRNILPKIHMPIDASDWAQKQHQELKLVLHPHSPIKLSTKEKPKNVCILIGPEGGFSETEIKFIGEKNFESIALGPRVLRTETAPIAALSVLQYEWGDFT